MLQSETATEPLHEIKHDIEQLSGKRHVLLELEASKKVPNEKTRQALLIAEAKESKRIADESLKFDDADEAIAYLRNLQSDDS